MSGYWAGILTILAINIIIVWYLFANKERLFRHHRHVRHED